MRSILTILATLITFVSVAQDFPTLPIGVVFDGGQPTLSSVPRSIIAVDLSLTTSSFTAGEYARYAQKYLGERAVLSSREMVAISGYTISLLSESAVYATPVKEETQTCVVSPAQGLPSDRTSADILSAEQRAQACAARLFANRRLARDLISGDIGEGVFGSGLSSALSLLDKEEQECLAQFMGSQTTTQTTRRFVVNVNSETKRYMLCRFVPNKGFISKDNIDGEAVYLQIIPSQKSDSTYTLSIGKEPLKRQFITPNLAQCDLYVGADIVTSAELPLYEFGSVSTILYDKK